MTIEQSLSALTKRIELLESSVQTILIRLEHKPRTTKALSEEEREARRIKINQASRESKMRARAKAFGVSVEEYKQVQAARKAAKQQGLLVEPLVETAEPEQFQQAKGEPELQPELAPAKQKGKKGSVIVEFVEELTSEADSAEPTKYLSDNQNQISNPTNLPSSKVSEERHPKRSKDNRK